MGRLSKVFNQAKGDGSSEPEITKERSNEFVNLNFKVSPEVRRQLKQYAANHDLSLKEVFEAAIAYYMEHHP
jgi:predicted HicB family RNase H-like nuclease